MHPHSPTDADIERALAAADPLETLRSLAREALDRQVPREELTATFTGKMLALRSEGREDEEDLVTDLLDFLTGWCSPQMRL
jgi:hypothetical protein